MFNILRRTSILKANITVDSDKMKTLFELVKVVLDELYAEGMQVYGISLDSEIQKRAQSLSSQYMRLTEIGAPKIDYSDPAARFAYVYKYVATHADYIYQILRDFRAGTGTPIFKGSTLRVTCLGGGPGSDIIGMLKYLGLGKETTERVLFFLCDGEQAWSDSWSEIDEALAVDSIRVSTNFQRLDVTDPRSWASQNKFLDADIFTLSYFVSEIVRFDGPELAQFWDALFSRANSGALFIFDDNAHDYFVNYFDKIWKAYGLEELYRGDKQSIIPSYSEQQSELGAYLTKFATVPKLKSFLSYRILLKP